MTLNDVWKIYRIGKVEYPALRGVSLEINRGEFISIVGPSGHGKTTLLNICGTIDRPTKGKVILDNTDLNSLTDNQLAELRNKKMGFVFQSFNLIPHLTAIENVELPMIALGIPPRERRRRALEILSNFLPESAFNKKPLELSGGEQQRVAIARALVNNPEIIIADEPTGNLDSVNSTNIARIFRELRDQGKTIVMATHNLELTSFADRIVRIRDGKIVEIKESRGISS